MGRFDTGQDEMDLGFKIHEKGYYLFQIDEGARVRLGKDKDEPDNSVALQLPLLSVKALDGGDEDAVGGKLTMFIYVKSGEGKQIKFGEDQIAQIIYCCGLAPAFDEKYGDDFDDFDDPKFLDSVILKTQGKMVKAYVDHEPDFRDKTKMRAKISKIAVPKKAGPAPSESEGSSEDW